PTCSNQVVRQVEDEACADDSPDKLSAGIFCTELPRAVLMCLRPSHRGHFGNAALVFNRLGFRQRVVQGEDASHLGGKLLKNFRRSTRWRRGGRRKECVSARREDVTSDWSLVG